MMTSAAVEAAEGDGRKELPTRSVGASGIKREHGDGAFSVEFILVMVIFGLNKHWQSFMYVRSLSMLGLKLCCCSKL